MEFLSAGKYGCRDCNAKPNQPHYPDCSDRDHFVDKAAYDRGWDDGRSGVLERREESAAYRAGFSRGVSAYEYAANVSRHDYYDD